MIIYKNRIIQGRLKKGKAFERIPGGVRLFKRLVGVSFETGDVIDVHPVYCPIIDWTFNRMSFVLVIGMDEPKVLISFHKFKFHFEKLGSEDQTFDDKVEPKSFWHQKDARRIKR